jgi:hypothetical protein
LCELGLRRAEIPFVVARPVQQRDQRPPRPARSAAPGNDNEPRSQRHLDISPIYFVK